MAEILSFGDYKAPDTIPDELKLMPMWLVWRLTSVPGDVKPRKIPFYANGQMRQGEQGSPNDRAQMVTYQQAVTACVKGHYSGIGFALMPDAGIVALDFDNCVTDGVVTVPFIAGLAAVTYCELSPSGTGVRAFMRGRLLSKKDTRPDGGKFAVEFFGNNGYVTVTGNVLPDCEMWGTEKTICELTPEVLALYKERFGETEVPESEADENDAWLLSLSPTLGWDEDKARAILMDCNATCGREIWVKCLAALHYETGGAAWGLELAVEWSETGDNYANRKDVEGRWKSFRRGGGSVVGGGWLLKYRQECLTKKKYSDLGKWEKEIGAAADEFTLRESVCPKIKAEQGLGDLERESLAQALCDRFKALGKKYPIASCRKLVTPSRVVVQRDVPEWVQGWCYITELDKYHLIGKNEWLSVQGFNARYNRFMPRDENGMVVMSASVMALEHLNVQVVTGSRYIPWCDDLFEYDGSEFVNSYRHSSVPLAVPVISGDAQNAVDRIVWHVREVICAGRAREAALVLSWMAYCVQNPGKKIRWAPLVKGIEGDGKSLICTVLMQAMGEANVKSISPTVIGSQFTSWAEGACVGFLEEIRLTGHSRYDILNALKPYLTNDRVEIHKKGQDPINVLNTMNYFAATNHADALPLNDTDRRWFVLFSKFNSKFELESLGANYFGDLHRGIFEYGPAIRRFFLDYQLCAEFDPNGTAPLTYEKSQMVAMAASDEETLIQEVIDQGAPGVTKTVLLTRWLSSALSINESDSAPIHTSALSRVLIKMGWTKLPNRVKWRAVPSYCWVKSSRLGTWEKAKAILDAADEDLFK